MNAFTMCDIATSTWTGSYLCVLCELLRPHCRRTRSPGFTIATLAPEMLPPIMVETWNLAALASFPLLQHWKNSRRKRYVEARLDSSGVFSSPSLNMQNLHHMMSASTAPETNAQHKRQRNAKITYAFALQFVLYKRREKPSDQVRRRRATNEKKGSGGGIIT